MPDLARKQDLCDKILQMRSGPAIHDEEFDLIYSDRIRRLSNMHWTPVEIARRAAELLVTGPETRVLDVGSGVGKFCTIGALTSEGFFTGIEQRRHLVDEALRVRDVIEVPRVAFKHGNMMDLDWVDYNAFYLFNPFFENIATYAIIDKSVSTGNDTFNLYVDAVIRKLQPLPVGTRVVTYHGFGGKLPDNYEFQLSEQHNSDHLNLWVKIGDGNLRSTQTAEYRRT